MRGSDREKVCGEEAKGFHAGENERRCFAAVSARVQQGFADTLGVTLSRLDIYRDAASIIA